MKILVKFLVVAIVSMLISCTNLASRGTDAKQGVDKGSINSLTIAEKNQQYQQIISECTALREPYYDARGKIYDMRQKWYENYSYNRLSGPARRYFSYNYPIGVQLSSTQRNAIKKIKTKAKILKANHPTQSLGDCETKELRVTIFP